MDWQRVRAALASTGDPQVDAAIQALASLEGADLAERPAVLEGVHDRLREILGELGAPGRPGAGETVRPGEPGRRGEQEELGSAFPPGGLRPRPGPPRPGMPGSWSRRPDA